MPGKGLFLASFGLWGLGEGVRKHACPALLSVGRRRFSWLGCFRLSGFPACLGRGSRENGGRGGLPRPEKKLLGRLGPSSLAAGQTPRGAKGRAFLWAGLGRLGLPEAVQAEQLSPHAVGTFVTLCNQNSPPGKVKLFEEWLGYFLKFHGRVAQPSFHS